jgi:hypothetical protein
MKCLMHVSIRIVAVGRERRDRNPDAFSNLDLLSAQLSIR